MLVTPQAGGEGLLTALHVALTVVNSAEHAERQSFPGLCFGHAALHVLRCSLSSPVHAFGHRLAWVEELRSAAATTRANDPARMHMIPPLRRPGRAPPSGSPSSNAGTSVFMLVTSR